MTMGAATKKIQVGIVDDHSLLRKALAKLIGSFENYAVLFEGDNGKEIKNKITRARTAPAGPKKQAKLEFYSDAADHCVFMKDIWRNNVSHSRKPYKPGEAQAVLERVRDFMIFLADNLNDNKSE